MLANDAAKILMLTIPFTSKEARSAYRKLAMKLHPDKGGTAKAFGQIEEAYRVCGGGIEYSFGTAPKIDIDGTEFRSTSKKVSIKGVVNWFAARILDKLMVHRHKGASWRKEKVDWLYGRLIKECEELRDELKGPWDKEKIINECADVAAFCMMIADNARRKL